MQLKTFLSLTLGAAAVSAQSLTEALAAQNASLSTLTGLISSQPALLTVLAGLTDITVLAPSNDALTKFLASDAGKAAAADPSLVTPLLTYHVLNGTFPASAFTATPAFAHTYLSNTTFTNVTGGQVVDGKLDDGKVTIGSGLLQSSTVTTADLNFTGGVIHIIDEVLTIPASPSDTAIAANLTGLVGALNATDLITTVDSLSDVTIFAPSNEAFDAIADVVANLTVEQISGVLQYHVVQGTVGYSSLLTNTTLKTVGGGDVTIKIIHGTVYVNDAKVVIPDVLVSNGVVHVIDSVLTPPSNSSTTPSPTPSASASATGGGSASASAGGGAATTSSRPEVTNAAAVQGVNGVLGMAALFGGAVVLNL